MAYVDQKGSGSRAVGIAGVVAIHVALGGIVITGLSTVVPLITEEDPIEATNIEIQPPPKPDEPEPKPQEQAQKQQEFYVPDPPFTFDKPSDLDMTKEKPDPDEFVFKPDPAGEKKADPFPKETPKPEPTFDPISARPSNNPGGWVTNSDYKSIWIRREWQGIAGFTLEVSPAGRVTDCRITSSTGYGELDDATCRLIRQRAKFTAARDGKGMKVAGRYSNSVRWQLPD